MRYYIDYLTHFIKLIVKINDEIWILTQALGPEWCPKLIMFYHAIGNVRTR